MFRRVEQAGLIGFRQVGVAAFRLLEKASHAVERADIGGLEPFLDGAKLSDDIKIAASVRSGDFPEFAECDLGFAFGRGCWRRL